MQQLVKMSYILLAPVGGEVKGSSASGIDVARASAIHEELPQYLAKGGLCE